MTAIPSGPVDSPDDVYVDAAEFRGQGYLQEVNRQFFHPLGLSLAMKDTSGGRARLFIIDHRDDPEGIVFADEAMNTERAKHIMLEQKVRAIDRQRIRGFVVQPVPDRSES